MIDRKITAAASCALLLIGWLNSHAEDRQPSWTFQQFQAVIADQQLTYSSDKQQSDELQKISDLLDRLHDRYVQRFGDDADVPALIEKNLPLGYSLSMAADLDAVEKDSSNHLDRINALQDVKNDLAMKVSFMVHSLGATGEFPSIIHVTVETVRPGGSKFSGLWVRCNPRRYGVTNHPLFVFNSATTPTESDLPPGFFVIWVEDAKHHLLLSQPVSLGGAGSDSEHITLAIP